MHLPDEVVARIDKHRQRDGTYRSRGELVKAAVLAYLADTNRASA